DQVKALVVVSVHRLRGIRIDAEQGDLDADSHLRSLGDGRFTVVAKGDANSATGVVADRVLRGPHELAECVVANGLGGVHVHVKPLLGASESSRKRRLK